MAFNFPLDLIALRRDLEAAQDELSALHARLPHRATPEPQPYTDVRGVSHPASPGWSAEDRAAVDAVWTRQQQLSAAIVEHPFWATLGPDAPTARMALKHLSGPNTNTDG